VLDDGGLLCLARGGDTVMSLTDTRIRSAKPAERAYKLSDGGGMYLLVMPDGARYWRMDYRFAGKRRTLALGVYPSVTLSSARTRREEALGHCWLGTATRARRRRRTSAPPGSRPRTRLRPWPESGSKRSETGSPPVTRLGFLPASRQTSFLGSARDRSQTSMHQ